MHHAKSLSQPLIKGLTVLLVIYTSRNYWGAPFIASIINFLNASFKLSIPIPNLEQTTIGTVEAIVLYTLVTIILGFYVFVAYNRKEVLREIQIFDEKEKKKLKIEFPEEPLLPSPIFYERIKRLFELKFEKESLSLNYDKKAKVLYGTHKYGLTNYCKIIYCYETVSPKTVDSAEANLVYYELKNLADSSSLGKGSDCDR
ncbi:MAG: hypothetical protein ABJB11_10385 [Ferruginibacter sp.]